MYASLRTQDFQVLGLAVFSTGCRSSARLFGLQHLDAPGIQIQGFTLQTLRLEIGSKIWGFLLRLETYRLPFLLSVNSLRTFKALTFLALSRIGHTVNHTKNPIHQGVNQKPFALLSALKLQPSFCIGKF